MTLILATATVLGTVFVGLAVLGRFRRAVDTGSEADHLEAEPEITTAKNLKWTRCEEDETMWCTVFT